MRNYRRGLHDPGALFQRIGRLLGTGSKSLRSRTIQGGGALILGDLYSNAVRLGANLIMTRLLYPEAFGLMLIVHLVYTGLGMMSDIGVRNALIVRQEDISDQYLRTAWTMNLLRGVSLAVVAALLAAPVSRFYGEEQLFELMLILSFAPIIGSLKSPYPMLAEKGVRFTRVVIWNGLSQTLASVILLVWLFIHPTILALAAHSVIAAGIATISSYLLFPGIKMKLAWDKVAAWEIFRVGRWLFIASGLGFLARQGDSLIVSKWISAAELGIFSIAVTFAKLVEMLVERMSWSLLFPVYAELRTGGIENFNAQLRRVKLVLYALCAPLVLVFALLGRDIVALLYDPRYHSAGWMLEVMAAGYVFFASGAAILNIPMSFGDSYRHMWMQVYRFVAVLIVMTVGGYLAGTTGLVVAIAVSQLIFYLILRLATHRYGIRDFMPDLAFMLVILSLIALGWWLRGWPL